MAHPTTSPSPGVSSNWPHRPQPRLLLDTEPRKSRPQNGLPILATRGAGLWPPNKAQRTKYLSGKTLPRRPRQRQRRRRGPLHDMFRPLLFDVVRLPADMCRPRSVTKPPAIITWANSKPQPRAANSPPSYRTPPQPPRHHRHPPGFLREIAIEKRRLLIADEVAVASIPANSSLASTKGRSDFLCSGTHRRLSTIKRRHKIYNASRYEESKSFFHGTPRRNPRRRRPRHAGGVRPGTLAQLQNIATPNTSPASPSTLTSATFANASSWNRTRS